MTSFSVSIIIPVFNVELYIEACIQSVMQQTYDGPIECVIVDDSSTDNSIHIAEGLISEYYGQITFKVLHHDHNRGASAARNTGMDAATGDYYYFLDSDDVLTVDCIEKLAEPLKQERYDVVVGCLDIVFNGVPFYPEQTLLIPDNMVLYDQEFADQTVSALSSLDKVNVMAHNAYEIGKTHFSKNSFFDVVKKSIDAIPEHQTKNKVCLQ